MLRWISRIKHVFILSGEAFGPHSGLKPTCVTLCMLKGLTNVKVFGTRSGEGRGVLFTKNINQIFRTSVDRNLWQLVGLRVEHQRLEINFLHKIVSWRTGFKYRVRNAFGFHSSCLYNIS